jgi:uncharacterized protein
MKFLLLAAVFLIALVWFANRSAFYPMKYPQGQWDIQTALGARDIGFTAWDGTKLHGWWVQPAQSVVTTLFFHGNAGNVTHRAGAFRALRDAGSTVFMVDYRGYGKSEGRPIENNLYKDADTAYDLLISRGYDPGSLIIHGESLGTAVAIDLASRRRCAGLVLEAPFPSAKAVAANVLPIVGPLIVWGFDSEKKIKSVRVPILFIQGDRDEVIPYSLGRRLFDAAPAPKEFWTVSGAGHNNLIEAAGPAYSEHLRAFYSQIHR